MIFVVFILPCFLAALLMVALALYALRYRRMPVTRWFMFGTILAALLCRAVWLVSPSEQLLTKYHLIMTRYFIIALIPITWLMIVRYHLGRSPRLSRWQWTMLSIIPALNVLLTALKILLGPESLDGFFIDHFRFRYRSMLCLLSWRTGPWYLIQLLYTLGIIAYGLGPLLRSMRDTTQLYRRQSRIIFIALLLPLVVEFFYEFHLAPVPGYHYVPFTFMLTGPMLAYGLFRYQMLNLIPIARSLVVDSMNALVLVFDTQQRLIDVNTRASNVLSPYVTLVLGLPAEQVFAPWRS